MSPAWQELFDLGFSIFPVLWKSKRPAVASWTPYQSRRPMPEEVAKWSAIQRTNVGIVTGMMSDIIVVDCDSEEAFAEVCSRGMPATPKVKTGRGWHIYLKWPGFKVTGTVKLFDGIDIRADGNYVVGPGSTHENGTVYAWDPSPDEAPIAPAPQWLLDQLKPKARSSSVLLPKPPGLPEDARARAYAEAAVNNEVKALATAKKGARNKTLNAAAFKLGGLVKAGYLPQADVVDGLLQASIRNGEVAEDGEQAVLATIASGLNSAPERQLPERQQANGRLLKDSEPAEDDAPRPLMRPLLAPEPFPIEALGPVLAAAARGVHERVRAPEAICCQSVLAAANLALQAHGDIELPNGQTRPLSLYFVSIAESGDRKSSADAEALWPVRKREAALRDYYDAKLPTYQADKLAYEKARDTELKKHSKDGRAAMREALDALGPAPAPPLKPLLLCSEPTYEGLFKLLAAGQPSLGLFSTEGGSFIGGHGMTDEAKLRTATGLSKLWDGAALDRVRAGDGDKFLSGRRLACHLMVQPSIAALLLSDETVADQGLLSRLLCTAPASLAGTRFWQEPSKEADAAIRTYGRRVLDILERPLPLVPAKANELSPRVLRLTDDARKAWIKFQDEVEYQLGAGGKFAPIKSRANKMPEMAARLAGTLALFDDIDAVFVHIEYMERGIALARHYAVEALRLADAAKVGTDLQAAQDVLSWLQHDWLHDVVSLPDIYQLGPSRIRTQKAASACVAMLEQHGWLHRLEDGAGSKGTGLGKAWRFVGLW